MVREIARLPGRSPGAGEINKDVGRRTQHAHGWIIIRANEYVKRRRPLDTPTVRTLACVNSRCRSGPAATPAIRTTAQTMLLSLALVIVLLSLLLTGLIGEQGVRGVPTRAT